MRDFGNQFYSRPLRHCRPTASATFASALSVAALILALGCAALVAAQAGGVVWGLANISGAAR